MTQNDNDIQPWYRQFWAWFILSPLIVVVIVSSITVSLAVKYKDDRVIDNYYKEGRMINMRLEEDQQAQSLKAKAALTFDREIQEVGLVLDIESPSLPEKLVLEFSHPLQADLDYSLNFTRIAQNQYRAEFPTQLLTHRWYLRLLPLLDDSTEQRWRLRGEIDFAQTQTITLKADG